MFVIPLDAQDSIISEKGQEERSASSEGVGSSSAEVLKSEYHVVSEGQNLYRIALQYHTSVERIKSLNGLRDNRIFVGQYLVIREYLAPNPQTYEEKRPVYTPIREGDRLYNPVNNAKVIAAIEQKHRSMLSAQNLTSIHIGIEHYEDDTFKPLPGARRDAREMEKVIQRQDRNMYQEVQSHLLLGDFTTYDNIRFALQSQAEGAEANDLLLISISGHAMVRNGELRILPRDYIGHDRASKYLTMRDILELITPSSAKILLVLDVCYSEQAGYDFAPYIKKDMPIAILVSSRSREKSMEYASLGHGIFTKAFLEAAAGKADLNSDGLIGMTEILWYVQRKVYDTSKGQQHANLPINFLGNIPLFHVVPHKLRD